MVCFTCGTSSFRSISAAMAKAISAKLRNIGVGQVSPDWVGRAAICEQCPLRVVQRGVSYCGTPFLQMIDRDPIIDGCGCPTRDKARSAGEHCPLQASPEFVADQHLACSCKWCRLVGQGDAT